jgi:Glycosyltransferase
VKDQLNLVRAVAIARGQGEAGARLRLVIAGDGPQRAEVEAEIAATGIGDITWLAGARSDVPEIMRALDIFALPSQAEGISNTILEAMASGLPVAATDVGGNAELVAAGETGALVPAQDPHAMAQAYCATLPMLRCGKATAPPVVSASNAASASTTWWSATLACTKASCEWE